jgi:hypothetical protein
MSKSVYDPMKDSFLVKEARELYVNIDLLYRNSSPQEFENLFREGGALHNIISSYKDSLKNNLKDVDIDEITQDYIPGENLKRNLRGTELNDIARNLVDLSDNILNKENPLQSIDKLRTNIGAGEAIKPSFFAKIQTFFVNIFTDNKTKQKANAIENFEIVVNKVLNESEKFALENGKTKEDLQKTMQQEASLPSDLPPPPSYNLNSPPLRDVPPIPGQFSGQTADLPPPPQFGPPTDLPPPLPPEFGGPPTDLPPPLPQGLNTFAADIPAPTDLPPPLPPEFGGLPTDLPPPLPQGSNTFAADIPSPTDLPPPLPPEFGGPPTDLPPPLPPEFRGPPSPPGPMVVKSAVRDPQIKTPAKPILEKGDFLKEIRDRKDFQLKKTGDRQNSLDQDEFKYSEIKKKEGMQAMLGGEYDAPSLVNGRDKSQQMNTLYSAVVGGNTKLTKDLVNITVEINTGKTIEDDWGDVVPVMETKKVYAKEDLEKIYSAAKSLESKEGVSKVQKVNIERGVAEIGKATGIESGTSQNR